MHPLEAAAQRAESWNRYFNCDDNWFAGESPENFRADEMLPNEMNLTEC